MKYLVIPIRDLYYKSAIRHLTDQLDVAYKLMINEDNYSKRLGYKKDVDNIALKIAKYHMKWNKEPKECRDFVVTIKSEKEDSPFYEGEQLYIYYDRFGKPSIGAWLFKD